MYLQSRFFTYCEYSVDRLTFNAIGLDSADFYVMTLAIKIFTMLNHMPY